MGNTQIAVEGIYVILFTAIDSSRVFGLRLQPFHLLIPDLIPRHFALPFEQNSQAMGDKKKKTFMFIRLVSAAGTGFFYVKRKSSKKIAEKLEFRKYDPRVNRHVLFTEQKMK
ncbi:uncharacterized protein [Euphorbia lathyris]|uniref:uncharacterized protein n=1 Tax=Euphorbia lathyris TaxID=212925 RepID=UPI003313BF2C